MTPDPATMTDADLAALLAAKVRQQPDLQAAAEAANRALDANAAAIRHLEAEATFRAAVKDLRKPANAKRLAILRALAATGAPIEVPRGTDWLNQNRLLNYHPDRYGDARRGRWTISDLGRRALAAVEPA